MVRNDFTFLSADKKTAIHAVEWLPEGEIRAVVQLSHGVSEYVARYEPFAAFLTQHGFAVVGHDHLGHGSSIAKGAAPLYFGPKGSWNWVVEDVFTRRSLAKEKFPSVPYFLLGHSMGSFIARTFLIRFPGSVDGAVIMGTGQMPAPILLGGQAVASLEGLRVGEHNSSALVTGLAFGSYNKPFAPNRTEFDWLSENEANVDAYIADPLCGGAASAGLFREMLGGMYFIRRKKNLAQMDKNTPILFTAGAMDPVGAMGKGVENAYRSFLSAGVQDVSLQLYPNMRHEILNENGKEQVCEDILTWLTAHLPA